VGDWGDTYGNRVDRFLATIAYLDGKRPSLVMARGYYTRTVLAAWNWRDHTLSSVWTFDTGHTGTENPYAAWRGMGNHNLSVGDVDGDGRDEIMYGASAIDDDGTGLFTTGLGHGDAIHMSDMDPDRPGLKVFQPHESPSQYGPNALELRDARTGGLIFGVQGSGDIGRGLALDVDPRYRGYEMWGAGPTGGMYTAQLSTPNSVLGPRGVQIASAKPSINFGVWWDGDLLRELLDGTTISKWNWLAGNTTISCRAYLEARAGFYSVGLLDELLPPSARRRPSLRKFAFIRRWSVRRDRCGRGNAFVSHRGEGLR
jgi:rhamnogalacturonan endolyase